MANSVDDKPRIFLFCEPGGIGPDDVVGYALDQYGYCLVSHLSSSVEWCQHDMGLTSDWKHDIYREKYPDGYELEWVDDVDNHEWLQEALRLNREEYDAKTG